jgi:hypothetical protein
MRSFIQEEAWHAGCFDGGVKRISSGWRFWFSVANLAIAGCAGDADPSSASVDVLDPDGGMLDASNSAQVLSRPELTSAECAELGGEPIGMIGAPPRLGDPGTDLSRDDECPGSRVVKGMLESVTDSNGGICCELPASVSVQECTDAGGRVLPDSGGGTSYILGCATGQTLVGWLASTCDETPCHTTGVCCR